jgi:Ca2+-binding RTX toxin-like protein
VRELLVGPRYWVLVTLAVAIVVLTACGGGEAEQGPRADSTSRTPASGTPGVTPTAAPESTLSGGGECFNRPVTTVGTPGADTIRAAPGRDIILGLGGNDHITGLRGRDMVCSGPGADVIDDVGTSASTKDDMHYTSAIRIDSGPGNDELTVGTAFKVYTGSGNDNLTVTHFALLAFLGPGHDHLTSTGWGVDNVHLEGGNDQVDNASPEVEATQRTVVYFDRDTTDMRVNLATGIAVSAAGNRERVQLHNIHAVSMGGGHNIVRGTPDMDYILAGKGSLIAYGGETRDQIAGGPGNDRIYAGGGKDSSSGNGGDDIIYSGPGGDWAGGGDGSDQIYGEAGSDYLAGDAGADQLIGGPGDDELYAGYECDTSIHRGGGGLVDSLPNELGGGDGDDYLSGDKGADQLDGGPGDDAGNGGWNDAGDNYITSVETLYPGCGEDF